MACNGGNEIIIEADFIGSVFYTLDASYGHVRGRHVHFLILQTPKRRIWLPQLCTTWMDLLTDAACRIVALAMAWKLVRRRLGRRQESTASILLHSITHGLAMCSDFALASFQNPTES
ncbi:hypothetical protein EJB05_37990, partial [Eragrostis curvula]